MFDTTKENNYLSEKKLQTPTLKEVLVIVENQINTFLKL